MLYLYLYDFLDVLHYISFSIPFYGSILCNSFAFYSYVLWLVKAYDWLKLFETETSQGVYFKKSWQGGSAYFLGFEILYFLIFVGLEKTPSFWGLKIFYLFFGLTIAMQFIFVGCLIKRSWIEKPPIKSNQILERKNTD